MLPKTLYHNIYVNRDHPKNVFNKDRHTAKPITFKNTYLTVLELQI
jgi:hypothetical protein